MNKIKTWNNISLFDFDQVVQGVKGLLKIPSVIILSGDVGAGKTTFVKRFAGQLDICSPTYSLITEYDELVHADLYRIENSSDLIHLELELYQDGKNYFFIEWGREYYDQLSSLLGDEFHYYDLFIEAKNLNKVRTYTLSKFA